ncbi:MAG: Fe-S cluster assembly protein SufD [Bacteroidales bacterium]|nr:Fe-S cluster assembly protein SufD [Bacteroidales bacterium]
MGALTQYIDLYREQHDCIAAGSAGALNALRPDALKALEGKQLPDKSAEGFEKTSIDEMFAPDFGVNVNRVNLPCDVASAFKCGVPNVSSLLAILVNDTFVPTTPLLKNLPEGVIVMSLAKAAELYPELVGRYYGSAARLDSTGTALNTLLAQDGVFIHIGKGIRLDKPIQIVALSSAPVAMLSPRRLLIVAEPESEATILTCDHAMTPDTPSLVSQVVEVIAGEGSRIDICDIEETSAQSARYSQLYARQEAGSDIAIGSMTLRNGVTRNEFAIDICGPHCESHISGMAIGSGQQHIDNSSSITHAAPRSRSNQLFKYVLDDKSTGAFEGSIEVTPSAPFTEAFQTDRNILASKDARMHTKPQLLIYNDEVKCSHGATTGQLDDQALFYMRSRGIPLEEARMMLMQAFMTDVVDTIRVEALRDRLRHLVERRLAGLDASCSECTVGCKSE